MELKTLEDLEDGKYMFKGLVRLDHLKQEAIKWIKEIDNPEHLKIRQEATEKEGFPISDEDLGEGIIATREWIKHFFNITEEELI